MKALCTSCGRPRLLDAFSGEGGAGAGYTRAGFCVTPVDNDAARLSHYPIDCPNAQPVKADAVQYIEDHGHEYAAGHGSPPCTGYSRGTIMIEDRTERYDRLIGATRAAFNYHEMPYVIENVEGARAELNAPLTLCWTMFFRPGSVTDVDGTPLWMRRHRLFETNMPLMSAGGCAHPANMQCAGAYGGARRDKIEARTIRKGGYVPTHDVMRRLLDTPWMTEKGCRLSIPPAYTEFLGAQMKEQIQ